MVRISVLNAIVVLPVNFTVLPPDATTALVAEAANFS